MDNTVDVGKVPFLDLVSLHHELEVELVGVFRSAIRNAAFIGGPMVEDFEREFAEFCKARYCIGVSSGTDALRFALIAAGVQEGDTVVTVPNTFIATTEAISQAGGTPTFVDIDERTYTIDPDKLGHYLENVCRRDDKGRLIDPRTGGWVTAIVPVHLYGQMADMDSILELAARYDLLVVEDACQAHGADYFSRKNNRWYRAGSMGNAAAFSFYPGKNLGACGEGGAITTNDESVAQVCRKLRDHGQSKKYFHDIEGYNGRLDAIQAGILRVKLRHLTSWNEQRRVSARIYDELLADSQIAAPHQPAWSRHVYHLYAVRVPNRELVQKHLSSSGIGTGVHYPIPLHLSAPYTSLSFGPGDLPIAERAAGEVLSLPMFPGLSPESQSRVIESLRAYVSEQTARRQAI
jgi:dTDP-4-amino-4,6-dideoxygalactose transaminase